MQLAMEEVTTNANKTTRAVTTATVAAWQADVKYRKGELDDLRAIDWMPNPALTQYTDFYVH